MTYDLTYYSDGLFTRFFPHTIEGENAWREMAEQDEHGIAAVLNCHEKTVIRQLRKAGYSVGKHKPLSLEGFNADELLRELEA